MEDLRFMRLWDCYQPLLTERQREITNFILTAIYRLRKSPSKRVVRARAYPIV